MIIRSLYLCLFSLIIRVLNGLSSTIIENKIYTIFFNADAVIFQVSVCELKEDLLARIPSTCKVYDLLNPGLGFELEILEVPPSLSEGNKKLWLRTMYNDMGRDVSNSIYLNWMGNINLADMKLNTVQNIIKKPELDKLPIFEYGSTTITNEYGSALYVVGGLAKVFNVTYGEAYSNSFYKYNFTTEVWEDMSLLSKGELPAIANPSLTIIGNRYLHVLGGRLSSNLTINSELQPFNYMKTTFNSPYNFWIFDTYANVWESVNLDVDNNDGIVKKLELDIFTSAAYDNKIYAPVGISLLSEARNGKLTNKMGILDLKSRKWNWVPLINEDGSNFKILIVNFNTIVFSDQVIISQVFSNENNIIHIYVFDIPSQRMKSSLRLSKAADNSESSKENIIETKETSTPLPTYAIALISVGCTIVLFLVLFYFYTKIKRNKSSSLTHKKKQTGRMQEVWANPDATNAENLYKLDKMKDDCNSNGTHAEGSSFPTKLFSNTLDKTQSV